jgi:hypothetical protein
MSKGKVFISALTGIFTLLVAWILLFTTKTLLESNKNNNLNYLPEKANFAVRLDGRELAEKTLFSVFIESKDEALLKMIRETIAKQTEKESELQNLGIDYMSDLVYFQINLEGFPVNGLLVNINNVGLFKKGFKNTAVPFAVKEDVGVILFKPEGNGLSNEFLTKTAEKILKKENHSIDLYDIVHPRSGTFFETYSSGIPFGDKKDFGKTNIHFGLDDQSLFIDGKMEILPTTSSKLKTLKKCLKQKGFHFSGTEVPTLLNDTLNSWLDQFGFRIPAIQSFSLNYFGTKIINHSSGFFIVPQMELYIETKLPFDILKLVGRESLQSYFDFEVDSNIIRIQEEELFVQQVSPNSFYIGVSPHPSIITMTGNEFIIINGNLKPFMNIEGGGLMTSFLEMIPEFSASKTLSNHIDELTIRFRKVSAKKARLQGRVLFGEDYRPMNELITYLINGEFIR